MAYPILKVNLPANLVGQPNGNLDPALLTVVHPASNSRLHNTAARAWKALVSAAAGVGLPLTFTYGGLYRTYTEQVTLFKKRYTPFVQYDKNGVERPRRWWNGGWWWLKVGAASAAVPGTSNHGIGLAIDSAFDNDPRDGVGPDDATYIVSHPMWNWFLANAPRFGFSWELQDEPWHIRYVAGDAIPQAVLDFEHGVINQLPPFIPELGQWGLWPFAVGKPAIRKGSSGDIVRYAQGVMKLKASQNIGPIDGRFGSQTEAGVINLQKFFGLTVDGWVGSQTWAVIDYLAGV